MEQRDVGIVGYGRFGRLWAELLGSRHRVKITDKTPFEDPRYLPLAELCETSRTLFLCVPINQFESVTREIAPLLQPGTTVFDTCSVKVYPAKVMTEELGKRADLTLIAAHPMFGPDSAANGVQGLPMVVWRIKGDEHLYADWIGYFGELGVRTVEMSPDEHDRLAAYTQGVTHYVGRVLTRLDLHATSIDTQGFTILRSLVEQTCNDSWELFRDLQTYNPYTREMRLRLASALDDVYRALE
jgi:prephenate dehydrogenase